MAEIHDGEDNSPTKNAISSSKSISLQGPNTGGAVSLGRVWPLGRRIGVPDTTTEEALPAQTEAQCVRQTDNASDSQTDKICENKCSFALNYIFEKMLFAFIFLMTRDRKSTRLNSSHVRTSRMPSSA